MTAALTSVPLCLCLCLGPSDVLLFLPSCCLGCYSHSQALWVGPGSRAARDKAAFEASFGPFYRVSQIIISTTPSSASNYTSTTGLPSIVTDANIRLLFDMQYLVDSLKGRGWGWAWGGGGLEGGRGV